MPWSIGVVTGPEGITILTLGGVGGSNTCSGVTIGTFLGRDSLDDASGTFTATLVCNILSQGVALSCILGGFVGAPLEGLSPFILSGLEITLFRVVFVSGIPRDTTIGRTMGLMGGSESNGFSNFMGNILHGILQRTSLLPGSGSMRSLSIHFSYPMGVVRDFVGSCNVRGATLILRRDLGPTRLALEIGAIGAGVSDFVGRVKSSYRGDRPFNTIVFGGNFSITGGVLCGGNFFRIRSATSRATISILSPGPYSEILSVYTTPNNGDFAVTRLVRGGNRVISYSVRPRGYRLVGGSTSELNLSVVGPVLRSNAMCGNSLKLFSYILYSIPYSKLNVVEHGPSVGCGSFGRFSRLPSVRLSVLRGTGGCLGSNNELLCSAYALQGTRGRTMVRGFLSRGGSFGLRCDRAFVPRVSNASNFFYTLLVGC